MRTTPKAKPHNKPMTYGFSESIELSSARVTAGLVTVAGDLPVPSLRALADGPGSDGT